MSGLSGCVKNSPILRAAAKVIMSFMSFREGVRSMLDRSVLKTFRPLIVTPCFGEKLCLNYVLSTINFQREALAAGLPFDFFFRPGDSLVTRVRNDCVAYFLANPGFTHLFWIDADIGF